MSAVALKFGLDQFIGKRRTHHPLRAVLQHFMKPRPGTPPHVPLAGRRILLAGAAGVLARSLQQAGAEVVQTEGGSSALASLHAGHAIDAVILVLDAPGDQALDTARALRAAGAPLAAIPVLGLAANPDAHADAAAAAGIDGLLARPVENTLLYETLTRLLSATPAGARPAPAAVAAAATSVHSETLLNLPRLESYRRLGMLDELVNDYLPELRRLMAVLHESAGRCDVQASLSALHSLLGMSGEAGAQGLYQHVRKLYVPLLENGEWPAAADWLSHVQQLALRTEEALRAYCAQQARSGAA